MLKENDLSRLEALKVIGGFVVAGAMASCVNLEETSSSHDTKIVTGDRFGEKVEKDELWGKYEVGKQHLGEIQRLQWIDKVDVDSTLIDNITGANRMMGIRSAEECFMEVVGDKSKALLPFVWTLDETGKVNSRWSIWSMENGEIKAPEENSENLVHVGLAKVVIPDDKNVSIIGPFRDNSIEPFITIVKNTHVTIKLPYSDSLEGPIPISNLSINNENLKEFLLE